MKDTNNAIDALNRLKSEGANTEAVRVLDGFVRSAARGAPLGSGDIREAFETHMKKTCITTGGRVGDRYANSLIQRDWETWQAALQSQTAPAVPEWTDKQCIEFMCHALRHVVYSVEGDSPTCDDIRLGVKAAMESAPQPDHSPDAGKVLQPDPVPYEKHERECGKLIDERDHAQDWADKLAGAIGEHFGIDIGEHSNSNCPWETAFENMPDSPTVEGTAYGLHHVSRMYQVMRTHDSTIDDVALDSMRDVLREVLAGQSPAPAADGGEVEPVGWIWETYGQRNFTAGTHHKNVLEADGLTLIPVYPHPAQPRNVVDGAANVVERLMRIRSLIEASPIDSLGTGTANNCEPWPIRDEVVYNLSRIIDRLLSNGGEAS